MAQEAEYFRKLADEDMYGKPDEQISGEKKDADEKGGMTKRTNQNDTSRLLVKSNTL